MRENCTYSLSGGRRRALKWAPPPTRHCQYLARISHTFSGNSNTLKADLASQVDEAVLLEHCPRLLEKQSQPPEVRFSPRKCEKSGLELMRRPESIKPRNEYRTQLRRSCRGNDRGS